MKNLIQWLNAYIIIIIAVWLVDLNVVWYKHPSNNIPILRYTIIGMSTMLFVVLISLFISRKK